MLSHPDHVGGIDEAHAGRVAAPVFGDLRLDALGGADQDHLIGVRGCVVDGPANNLARSEVAAHRVDRDAHARCRAQRWPSAGAVDSTGTTSRPS
jgi:hypothetical protein